MVLPATDETAFMSTRNTQNPFLANFLGHAPDWYKFTIVAFLLINPLVFSMLGGTVAGWLLIAEFIFTLAMALKCYPLLPGGLRCPALPSACRCAAACLTCTAAAAAAG